MPRKRKDPAAVKLGKLSRKKIGKKRTKEIALLGGEAFREKKAQEKAKAAENSP